jgi:glyoxylase I family protein
MADGTVEELRRLRVSQGASRYKEIVMNQEASVAEPAERTETASFVQGMWGVRYQVRDVERAIDFYTKQLGFKLDFKHAPAFGQVSIEGLKLVLSGPGASGSRPMPGGHEQVPGGWNRFMLKVDHLADRVEALKKKGLHFRNQIETGPGGSQIQVEDPDGNPIELFEPAREG